MVSVCYSPDSRIRLAMLLSLQPGSPPDAGSRAGHDELRGPQSEGESPFVFTERCCYVHQHKAA